MATIIKADGTASQTLPDPKVNDGCFTLEYLQGVVGGYIEVVALPHDRLMVVNEEGLIRRLPYNGLATDIVRHERADLTEVGAYIVGDVIVLTMEEFEIKEHDEESA